MHTYLNFKKKLHNIALHQTVKAVRRAWAGGIAESCRDAERQGWNHCVICLALEIRKLRVSVLLGR